MNRLRKFLHLPWPDRLLLIRAALLLGAIRLGLRLLPFQTLCQLLTRLSPNTSMAGGIERGAPNKVAWGVVLASRYLPGRHTCLAQALATQVLLARCGCESNLRIGVAKGAAGRLQAHAWVESQGRVVIGAGQLARYQLLLPGGGETP
jgi:hypothetical protein